MPSAHAVGRHDLALDRALQRASLAIGEVVVADLHKVFQVVISLFWAILASALMILFV